MVLARSLSTATVGRPLTTAKEIAKVIDQIEKFGAQVADASCPVEKFATFKGVRSYHKFTWEILPYRLCCLQLGKSVGNLEFIKL